MAAVIFKGDSFTAVRAAVLERLKRHRGEPNTIIVPDEYSFAVERAALESLSVKCAFDVEVASFSRLADKLTPARSGVLNKQTSVILLRRAIGDVADSLKCYNRAAKMRGFAREMYAVITNIRNSGVTPAALKRILPSLRGGVAVKTEDVAKIYEAYVNYLNEYCDVTGMLERLYEFISNDESVTETNYYITDFYNMADIKLKILSKLLERGANVYIGALEFCGRNKTALTVSDKLIALAEAHGAKSVRVCSAFSPEKQIIADNLFSYGVNTLMTDAAGFDLTLCPSTIHELEFVAESIVRDVKRGGMRYREISVVVPETAKYSARLKRVFTRYGIPYYIDERYRLSDHTLYKSLAAAVRARGFGRAEVLSLVKERAFYVADAHKEAFENYCLKENIDGRKFLNPFKMAELEEIRVKAVKLIELAAKECMSADEYAKDVNAFYDLLDFPQEADALGAQIPDKIASCLDSVKSIFDGMRLTRAELDDAFFTALESVEISTVPLYIDSVFVGDSGETRFDAVKKTYIIGANDGAYPRTFGDGGILRDDDCEAWAAHGVIIETAAERDKLNKLNILETLLKSESIVITSLAGKADSLMKIQVKKLLGLDEKKAIFNYSAASKEEIAEHMASAENYRLELASGYYRIDGAEYSGIRAEKYATASGAFYKGNVSPSSIEKFYRCPYEYFADKVLRLKRREEAGETVQMLGTFMHDVLERYYKRYKKGNEDIDISAREICAEVLSEPEYADLINSGDSSAVIKMLTARAVYGVKAIDAEFIKSEFQPLYLEYAFGGGEEKGLEFEVDGKRYNISGKIDRIDAAEIESGGEKIKCIAVIDYKSSEKNAGEKKLQEGVILQLPIYTAIAARNLGALPAAMLYAAVPTKYVAAGEKPHCTGYVLGREEILRALDPDYIDPTETFLPFYNKSKTPRKLKGVIDEAEFNAIIERAVSLMKNAVKIIETSPLLPTGEDGECRDCDFKMICGKEKFLRAAETGGEA